MKPANIKERTPSRSYYHLAVDGVTVLLRTAGLSLIAPAVLFLVLGVAALLIPAAAALIVSIGFSTVVAIEGALIVGACLLAMGGWISNNFGTPAFEAASKAELEAEAASSNVRLPRAVREYQCPQDDTQAQKSHRTVAAEGSDVSGLLKLGKFSHTATTQTDPLDAAAVSVSPTKYIPVM